MSVKALELNMGLRNAASQQYLTQETFGFAMNCNGKSLKKKQTFTLVTKDGGVHLRTHLGKYFYGDGDGNVKGDADAPSAATQWTIVPQTDGTWGLKSAAGFFFHGSGDNLRAFTGGDVVPPDGKWVVHLAMHPQINLFNSMRKRYISLRGDQLTCNEDVPWGEDALLSLIFFADHPTGRYGIVASNGKYLENSGRLLDAPNGNCQFLIGFHDDQISFCDAEGRFLQCIGSDGILKVNKDRVTKDELFRMQDSEPQFTVRNLAKNMQVSVRNGAEVKADQKVSDVQDTERFQFEVDNGVVHIMSDKLKYWSPRADGSISVETDKQSAQTAFVVDYSAGNTVRFVHKATGKHVYTKPNGAMFANGDGSEESGTFELTIINRPTLILRGQYGFLGIKGASGRVECNRSQPDVFKLTAKGGEYYLSAGGVYWTVDRDGVAAASSSPVPFFLEFVQRSRALVKHKESGRYLEGEQNGGLKATGDREHINTLWEF